MLGLDNPTDFFPLNDEAVVKFFSQLDLSKGQNMSLSNVLFYQFILVTIALVNLSMLNF